MSKLYYADQGFAIPTQCEEVSKYRRAAKVLQLPKTALPAQLFILVRAHSHQSPALNVSINGHLLPLITPIGDIPAFAWRNLAIPVEFLREGENRFEIWSSGDGMNAWTLAMETLTSSRGCSFASLDGGMTWKSDQLGAYSRCMGEYLVRVRLVEGEDPAPPAWVSEDFSHPRLSEIRALLPEEVSAASSTFEQVRCLSSWIAQSWEYCSSAYASLYAPWDAATILGWGKARKGQNGQRPVVMCVHYAVAFITACQSIGIHARALAFTEAINSFNGHFASEVWLPELHKWVFVDPNLDAVFFKDGQPISISEMRNLLPNLAPYVNFGPGYIYQIQNPSITEFMQIYLNGRFMQQRALWPRADFLSHPELTPPSHGSLAYCETGFVWERNDGLEMFPYLAGPAYFTAAPDLSSQTTK